jgi:glycosyltransferase involved in cell wall biosynthesis
MASIEIVFMQKIAIIIITYRRPQGLAKLLTALASQKFNAAEITPFVQAIVVDNDSKSTASLVVNDFASKYDFPIHYIHEPRQGIPIARNTGIDAVPKDFNFFCFIDDDEWPGETWLRSLLDTQLTNNADCVLGAVIPVYPKNAPAWIIKSRVFDSWRFKDNARLKEAASNNVLISNSFINKHNHRFDERMRMTGGSDYLFFKQAFVLGLKIYWSDNASVFEDLPITRLNFKWIMQRQFRLGNTFAVSEKLVGPGFNLMILGIKGILRILFGLTLLPITPFSFRIGMKGFCQTLRGLGILTGILGHSHQEYSVKNLLKERS